MTKNVWRKSSHSGTQGDCVELAPLGRTVGLRDSKAPEVGYLDLRRDDLAGFLARVKAGELDRP